MEIKADTRIYFGRALRRLLKEKNMTQGDIFRATGMERSKVSRFGSDKIPFPRLQTVSRISKALGMNLSDFVAVACSVTEEINNEKEPVL